MPNKIVIDPILSSLLPPLSGEEKAALQADIAANGVHTPIFVDENNVVLDGHTRIAIDETAPRRVIAGLSPAEKEAFVFRSNLNRRNLSPEAKDELRQKMKTTAEKLRSEDEKKWTQAEVAKALGVGQQTVSDWFRTNTGAGNGTKTGPDEADGAPADAPTADPAEPRPDPPKRKKKRRPDARTKLSPEAKVEIASRHEAGESQSQIAADFGCSQKQVSNVIRAAKKEREKQRAEQEAVRRAEEACKTLSGVVAGDFRDVAKSIPDESVRLIFTDPPYDRESLGLYADLAKIASRKLIDGGSLLCYLGHYLLPQVLEAVGKHLRYWWPLAVIHTGKSARMREYGVIVGWKPILWFVKGSRGDKQTWVPDTIVSAMEKTTHKWQQSVLEASHCIARLTKKKDLVFDPFCGAGTTAVAAKLLGRRFITCDVDDKALALARKRIKETGA